MFNIIFSVFYFVAEALQCIGVFEKLPRIKFVIILGEFFFLISSKEMLYFRDLESGYSGYSAAKLNESFDRVNDFNPTANSTTYFDSIWVTRLNDSVLEKEEKQFQNIRFRSLENILKQSLRKTSRLKMFSFLTDWARKIFSSFLQVLFNWVGYKNAVG